VDQAREEMGGNYGEGKKDHNFFEGRRGAFKTIATLL